MDLVGKIYKLEDDMEYYVIDTVEFNNHTFVLLSEASNEKSICIRKVVIRQGKTYLLRIENEEFNSVIELFKEKNENLID